jgi:hypothetical protein
MIDTTLGQLAEAEPALARLAAEKLPFRTAHLIAKLAKAVAEETKYFHEERNALVKEFGEVKPGGTPDEIQVGPTMASWPAFVAKVNELVAVPVTIPLAPIDLTTLAPEKLDKLEVSAADLLLLDGSLVLLPSAPEAQEAVPTPNIAPVPVGS